MCAKEDLSSHPCHPSCFFHQSETEEVFPDEEEARNASGTSRGETRRRNTSAAGGGDLSSACALRKARSSDSVGGRPSRSQNRRTPRRNPQRNSPSQVATTTAVLPPAFSIGSPVEAVPKRLQGCEQKKHAKHSPSSLVLPHKKGGLECLKMEVQPTISAEARLRQLLPLEEVVPPAHRNAVDRPSIY